MDVIKDASEYVRENSLRISRSNGPIDTIPGRSAKDMTRRQTIAVVLWLVELFIDGRLMLIANT
jgi:hypothetical protein